MDQQDQRMECLRMAIELGGKTEPIVSAAQQLLDFVSGTQHPVIAASTELASVEAAEPRPGPADAPEAVATDAIAACGTALVMPNGGELADAVPSAETVEAPVPCLEASAHRETVGDAVTEEASAEASLRESSASEHAPPANCNSPTLADETSHCASDSVQVETTPCVENAATSDAETAEASAPPPASDEDAAGATQPNS